ncbi:MAG TPA: hypothetical protein DGB72_02440 [Gemmatimonadetes bacterium]|nr:hypothetical protein [Gemmatimonadota bacterium]
MKHSPRESHLYHSGRRVREPIGERIVRLARVEQPITVVAEGRIDRAVPCDTPPVRNDDERIPLSKIVRDDPHRWIVYVLNRRRFAARDGYATIWIVRAVDQQLTRLRPSEIEDELEPDWRARASAWESGVTEISTIRVDPDLVMSVGPVDSADVEPQVKVGRILRDAQRSELQRRRYARARRTRAV